MDKMAAFEETRMVFVRTCIFFCYVVALALFANGCQKKEEKATSRCIYDQPLFAEVFLQAANQEEQFLTFKRNPYFNLLWENQSQEEGERWLQKIQAEYPAILANLPKLRQNDKIGHPRTYFYQDAGVFSPSTLRLSALAGEILQRHGPLKEMDVVQIGAGCGSLCKILYEVSGFKSYTIIDLLEPLSLARKCLNEWGVENVTFLTVDELPNKVSSDLVISDLSFSEFDRPEQEKLIDRILKQAASGYLACRIYPKHFGVVPMSLQELSKQLKKSKNVEILDSLKDREDYFVSWNQ